MKIELHMLQNFAPSCLNRDDTNSPKDCEFGGFRRARISSQCLKRSIRTHPAFVDALQGATGVRTKLLAKRLRERLADMGEETQVSSVVSAFVEAFASALDKGGEKTKVLLYLGNDEIARMETLLRENWTVLVEAADAAGKGAGSKAKDKSALELAAEEVAHGYQSGTRAADIAMFGRMVAEFPEMNLEAACQVAHAISTHKVSMELDFYTAVNDLQPHAETGAGMMGTVEFNSACFYRYALADVEPAATDLGRRP